LIELFSNDRQVQECDATKASCMFCGLVQKNNIQILKNWQKKISNCLTVTTWHFIT